eukprot:2977464-Rhodomonas_salina.1
MIRGLAWLSRALGLHRLRRCNPDRTLSHLSPCGPAASSPNLNSWHPCLARVDAGRCIVVSASRPSWHCNCLPAKRRQLEIHFFLLVPCPADGCTGCVQRSL